MSKRISLGSTLSNTKMRTPENLSLSSGMCCVCTANCVGPCEIGLSAVRGSEAIYPYATDINQFASEKEYSLDFSHFNINGRVFQAKGESMDPYEVTYPKAEIKTTFGIKNPIPVKGPYILPAIAKLNWQDYYAGAAVFGVPVVIGEDVVAKDKALELDHNKVINSPLIKEMVDTFRKYYHGYGDIILQANMDDEYLGVLDYAIEKLGVESVEIKFGQAAKGIQGMGRIKDINDALKFQKMGYVVYPDPSDSKIAEAYKSGIGQVFERIGKLPVWDEDHFEKRIAELRAKGAKRICFKTGPFDPEDLLRILKIASKCEVDLVTFDGAGGGTGNSPVKMMNEWGIPTVELECIVYALLEKIYSEGYKKVQVAITGGIAMEDQVYKALSLGAPYINFVAIGRATMAAAISGKHVGDAIDNGKIFPDIQRFGNTKEEIFEDIKQLKTIYEDAVNLPAGAIGVYSYLERVSTGVKQLMALNRRFDIKDISRADILPMTALASEVSGLDSYSKRLSKILK